MAREYKVVYDDPAPATFRVVYDAEEQKPEKLGIKPIDEQMLTGWFTRRMIISPVKFMGGVAQWYNSLGEDISSRLGFTEAAKDFRASKKSWQEASTKLDWYEQYGRKKNPLFGSQKLDEIASVAHQTIHDASSIGALPGGAQFLPHYYGQRAASESYEKHPNNPGLAIFHGLLEGGMTALSIKAFGASTGKLVGENRKHILPVINRVVARARQRGEGFSAAIEGLISVSAETIGEVLTETGHYFGDVTAGVKKFDSVEFKQLLADTAATAGLTAGQAEAVGRLADVAGSRFDKTNKEFASELDRTEKDLRKRWEEVGRISEEELRRPLPMPESQKEWADMADDEKVEELANRADTFERLKKTMKRAYGDDLSGMGSAGRRMMNIFESGLEGTEADFAAMAGLGKKQELPKTPEQERLAKAAKLGETKPGEEISAPATQQLAQVDEELDRLADLDAERGQLKHEIQNLSQFGDPAPYIEHLNAIETQIAERLAALQNLTGKESSDPSRTAYLDKKKTRAEKAIAKIRAEKDKLKQNQVLKQENVDAAFEYMRSAVPPSQRQRLGLRAARVTDNESLGKFLAEADTIAAQYEKKIAHERLRSAASDLSRLKNQSIDTPDIDMAKPQRRKDLEEVQSYYARHSELNVPAYYKDAFQSLGKESINDLSAAEANQMADAINAVMHLQQTEKRLHGQFREAELDEITNSVLEELGQNLSYTTGFVGEMASDLSNTLARPETVAAGMSETVRGMLFDDIGTIGYRNELRLKMSLNDEIHSLLNDLGLTNNVSIKLSGSTPFLKWRDNTKNIGGESMTRAEALTIYASALDPENRENMLNGGITLQRVRGVRRKKKHLDINDAILRDAEEFIGPEGAQIADFVFERFNTRARDAVASVWQETFGDNPFTRTDYFPRTKDQDWVAEIEGPEDFMAKMGEATLESMGITKARTEEQQPIEIRDFFDVATRHIDQVSRIYAYLTPVNDFFKVMRNQSVKTHIIDGSSQGAYDGLVEAVKQQVLPVRDQSVSSRIGRKFAHGSGMAVLAMNMTTPFMNAAGMPIAAANLPKGSRRLGAALVEISTNPLLLSELESRLSENSPYWRYRYGEHFLNEISGGVLREGRSFMPRSMTEGLMLPIQTMDKLSGLVRMRAVEAYVQEDLNVSTDQAEYEEIVAREWEKLMFRSETTSHGIEANSVIREGRRNGLFAPFAQFNSAVSKANSVFFDAKREYSRGNYREAARKLGLAAAVIPISAAIRVFFSNSDDEKERDFIRRLPQEGLRQVPVVGEAMAQTSRAVMGMKTFADPTTTTGSAALRAFAGVLDLGRAANQFMTDNIDSEGDPKYQKSLREAFANFAPVLGSITHFPVERTYRAGKEWLTDGAEAINDNLRKTMRAIDEEVDIKQPLARIRRSIRTDDDDMFLKAIEEIKETNPGRLNRRTLQNAVDGRFRLLDEVERHPNLPLTDQQRRSLQLLQAERAEWRAGLGQMLDRNAAEIENILSK